MKIQYCSDLHLEFKENKNFLNQHPIEPTGEILILAGDIVPFKVMDKHADFFSYLSDHFKTTFWIPGNHEYYYFDAATKSGVMNEKIKNNVHLVNNLTVRIDTVQFIFSILWTNIIPAHQWQIQRGMSDFHVINYEDHPLSTKDYNHLHADCLSFIKQELEKKNETKNVVVTHHVPTLMNYPQKYRGDALNDAFAVELFDLIDSHGPDYWIYGHTHSNTADFEIGKTQLLTNQLGYVKYDEHENFNNKATFNI